MCCQAILWKEKSEKLLKIKMQTGSDQHLKCSQAAPVNSDDGGSSVELQTSRSQSIEERGISSYHQLFGQRHQCLKRHSDFANFLLQRRLENNHTRTTAKKELYYSRTYRAQALQKVMGKRIVRQNMSIFLPYRHKVIDCLWTSSHAVYQTPTAAKKWNSH